MAKTTVSLTCAMIGIVLLCAWFAATWTLYANPQPVAGKMIGDGLEEAKDAAKEAADAARKNPTPDAPKITPPKITPPKITPPAIVPPKIEQQPYPTEVDKTLFD